MAKGIAIAGLVVAAALVAAIAYRALDAGSRLTRSTGSGGGHPTAGTCTVLVPAADSAADDCPRNPREPAPPAASDSSPTADPSRQSCTNGREYVYDAQRLEHFLDLEWRQVANRLADSTDAEHLLAASLLVRFKDRKYREELLARALATAPRNAVVLGNYLELCLQHPDAPRCRGGSIERMLLAVDGQNGAMMAAVARRRAGRGDESGAIDALLRGATAPRFDEYQGEHVLLIDRALSAAAGLDPADRLAAAFGIVPVSIAESAYELCRDRLDGSSEWRHACLGYALRMERDGVTYGVKALGMALQQFVHELEDDGVEAAAAERRRQELRAAAGDGGTDLESRGAFRDPYLIGRYIENLAVYGHMVAVGVVREEFQRRQRSAPDGNCTE